MTQAFVMDCLLRADSPIYYATREIGSFYETGDHLHNFALTYALGLATSDYHVTKQQPSYAEHLSKVTEQGIYVTPGTPRRISYLFSNLKFGSERWHEPERDTNYNFPNYGRIKEIAPDSEFMFRIISAEPQTVPRWIRVGIWMSKCEVITQQPIEVTLKHGNYRYSDALNPLDLPPEGVLQEFDIVSMPPSSLIRNVNYKGAWWVHDSFRIPAFMTYLSRHHV